MSSWKDVEAGEPEFAERVRGLVDARRHKTLATVRVDGSPRLSGIETVIADGELTFGSMPDAWKGRDLRRDPRCSLQVLGPDPADGQEGTWVGDVTITGRAEFAGAQVDGPPGDAFRVDIASITHVHLDAAAGVLQVDTWTPERGLRRAERA